MDLAPSGLTTIMDRLRCAAPRCGRAEAQQAQHAQQAWRTACSRLQRLRPSMPLPGPALRSINHSNPVQCKHALLPRPIQPIGRLPRPPDPRRTIISEGNVDVRTQYLVEGLFSLRKANFEGCGGKMFFLSRGERSAVLPGGGPVLAAQGRL